MGILIQGRFPLARPNLEEKLEKDSGQEYPTRVQTIQYPWKTLTGPKGTKPQEVSRMVDDLKRLVNASKGEGVLLLPRGWRFDLAVSTATEEIPNEIA